jgi:DNA-binding HxlR family transcriptional regulator
MINNKTHSNKLSTRITSFGKTKDFGRLLGLDGTIELMILIHEKPRQYKDIEAKMEFSHTSLLRRLNMLQNLNIIRKQPIRSKRRGTHVYELTKRGEIFIKDFKDYEKEIKLPVSQQKITETE